MYLTAKADEFPSNISYLINYDSIENGYFSHIVKIIYEKYKTTSSKTLAFLLSELFNCHSDTFKNIQSLFFNDWDLLETIYITLDREKDHLDYDGKAFSLFIDKNPDFLKKYFADKFEQNKYLSKYDESRDYSILWQREDYLKIMAEISKIVLEVHKSHHCWDYYEAFYNKNVNSQTDESIIKRQDKFLKQEIAKKTSNIEYIELLFTAVVGMKDQERKYQFYILFLMHNSDFNDFKKLNFYPTSETFSGSRVPKLQEKINFYERIIAECNSVSYLKHRHHLEQNITYLRKEIRHEKRRDFTEEW